MIDCFDVVIRSLDARTALRYDFMVSHCRSSRNKGCAKKCSDNIDEFHCCCWVFALAVWVSVFASQLFGLQFYDKIFKVLQYGVFNTQTAKQKAQLKKENKTRLFASLAHTVHIAK